jgi:hypothetical protein
MRLLKLAVLTVAATVVTGGSASAAFHLMKVSEVYPGTGADPDSAFIELQMFSSGQNFVGGHEVTVYDAAGALAATVQMNADVDNGQNNRTILLGDSNVSGRDFDADVGTLIAPAGGAVCFVDASPSDCVAWGNFVEPMGFPAATGTAAQAIPDGQSLSRSIAPGCATLLEASDDTDDSAADFALGSPSGRGNADPVTEQPCGGGGGGGGGGDAPETRIDSGPKKKTSKKKAKFTFSADVAGATFECKLDKGAFAPCASPKTYKGLKRGKHKFSVRATAAGETDASPATYAWKVKKKKKR